MTHELHGAPGALRLLRRSARLAVPLVAVLALASCGDSGSESGSGESATAPTSASTASPSTTAAGLDTGLFLQGALATEPTTEALHAHRGCRDDVLPDHGLRLPGRP